MGGAFFNLAVLSMSGMTSQPSMGALVSHYAGSSKDCGFDLRAMGEINEYWESLRGLYAPFGNTLAC
jgi:pyruvate carboxylase